MSAVGDLLAVMHSDGGHYTQQHGLENSARAALRKHYRLRAQLDALESGPSSALPAQVDQLAQVIRTVDGDNTLGAAALAEKLVARGVIVTGLPTFAERMARESMERMREQVRLECARTPAEDE